MLGRFGIQVARKKYADRMRALALIFGGLSITVAALGGAADVMKRYTSEVCGHVVTVELHPDVRQPAIMPRKVVESELPTAGNASHFLTAMYDYRRAWQRANDGRVVVNGTVVRRTVKRREEGLSFFDIDRLIEAMKETAPEFSYEKTVRNGAIWIRRVAIKDLPAGRGRNVAMEWLVPLQHDILLVFRVALEDYATRGSQSDARWYSEAEAMQKRLFESLRVDRVAK